MEKFMPSSPAVVYDDNFYKRQVLASLRSARIVLRHLWRYLEPNSVLDVGCGRGSWLLACRELGSSHLFGLDGDWNSQAAMMHSDIQFRGIDLNQPFYVGEKVDLAMSLEVAEHLEPSSSKQFVDCLTKASDSVLFSAAYIGQGGTNHINERRHSWWAHLFLEKDYVPFDLFREAVWGDERVHPWYRQNTFLYVKRHGRAYEKLKSSGVSEVGNISFLDCIHPGFYEGKVGIDVSFRVHVKDLIPSLLRAIRRRIPDEYKSDSITK
jgi:SAM-dependent methyltransferase